MNNGPSGVQGTSLLQLLSSTVLKAIPGTWRPVSWQRKPMIFAWVLYKHEEIKMNLDTWLPKSFTPQAMLKTCGGLTSF